TVSPGISAPLSDLTMRLLAKVMADRPQTAQEVVVILVLIAGQPARPPAPGDEPIPLVRESPPAVHPRRGGSTPALPVARLIPPPPTARRIRTREDDDQSPDDGETPPRRKSPGVFARGMVGA